MFSLNLIPLVVLNGLPDRVFFECLNSNLTNVRLGSNKDSVKHSCKETELNLQDVIRNNLLDRFAAIAVAYFLTSVRKYATAPCEADKNNDQSQ